MKLPCFYFLVLVYTIHFANCCNSNNNSEGHMGKKFTKLINDEISAEVNIVPRNGRTVMNCSSESFMLEHCQISHRNKICKVHFKDGRFKKLSTCDRYFKDVKFDRTNDKQTCQIVIEETKFKHGGIWICKIRKNLIEYNNFITKAFKVEVVKMSDHDMMLIVAGVEFCAILMGLLSFTCLKYFEGKPEPNINCKKTDEDNCNILLYLSGK